MADALTTPFSCSLLTVSSGQVSKRLIADAHGRPIRDSTQSQQINAGTVEHAHLHGLSDLAALFARLTPRQALVHGIVKDSRPGDLRRLTTTAQVARLSGAVARSLDFFAYPPDVFLLMFDVDAAHTTSPPDSPEQLIDTLADRVWPGMQEVGWCMTVSTSSAIKSKATGDWLTPPTGMHVYVLACGDLDRWKRLFHARLWLAGLGRCVLATPNTATGVSAVLERFLVDLSVFSPERVDYCTGARIAKDAPFVQDRPAPRLHPGGLLDLDAWPDLSPEEDAQVQALVQDARAQVAPERAARVRAVLQGQAPALTAEAIDAEVQRQLEQSDRGILAPEHPLVFANGVQTTAGALTAELDSVRLADPVEPDYGPAHAVLHWRGGDVRIVSWAHGVKRVFEVEHTYPYAPAPEADEPWPEPPPPAPAAEGNLPYSDYTNALAFVHQHGADVRYVYPWHKWLVWSGTHWHVDDSGAVMRLAKQTVKRLAAQAEALDDFAVQALLKHVKASLSTAKLKALVECAESEPGVAIAPEQLDADPWLLNCANGTVDLRTGTLQPHQRADYLTHCLPTAFDPQAACPLWTAFLTRVIANSSPLIDFLQRMVGYSLTGVIREHVLPILYGTGRNGKSTFLNTVSTLLGPYAMKAPSELLMASGSFDRHPTERADLHGKRFVSAIETEEGRKLAEVFVKEMTGGDPIRARRMREDFWEFLPTHKVWLATNHQPKVSGTDDAIWRRLKLVPFLVQIPEAEQDTTLPEKLREELPGILAWAVQGCLAWQQTGLLEPDVVKAATAGYRQEQDVLGAFLEERCFIHGTVQAKASLLYDAYKTWCEQQNERPVVQRNFGRALTERGLQNKKVKGMVWWKGITLLAIEEDDEVDDVDEGRRISGINSYSPLREGNHKESSSTSSTSSTSPPLPRGADGQPAVMNAREASHGFAGQNGTTRCPTPGCGGTVLPMAAGRQCVRCNKLVPEEEIQPPW